MDFSPLFSWKSNDVLKSKDLGFLINLVDELSYATPFSFLLFMENANECP